MGACTSSNKHSKRRKTFTKDAGLARFIQWENIQDHYEIGESIGIGEFGSVMLGKKINAGESLTYAIKSIPKSKLGQKQELLERELSLLLKVRHPNIVRVYDVFEDPEYIHIVMEHCSGGELFNRLTERGRYTEAEAAKIMYSLLYAVSHLHALNISHRDIKPENIMFSSRQDDAEIKLIDFGFAKYIKDSAQSTNTIVGSPYYIAPEVLDQNYGLGCDIWSLGVIMYILLIGKPPFPGSDPQTVLRNVIKGMYEKDSEEWAALSEDSKDLLRQMLCKSISERISAQAAMEHPWLRRRSNSDSQPIQKRVFRRIKSAEQMSKFQKEVMNVLVRCAQPAEIAELNDLFRQLDRDHTGYISAAELGEGLAQAGVRLESEEIESIVGHVDQTGLGKIDYRGFLAATLDRKYLHSKKAMWMAFRAFDVNNSGFITKDNLKTVLTKGGWAVDDEEIDAIMRDTQVEHIDFDQFRQLFESSSKVHGESSTGSLFTISNQEA